MIRRYSEFSKEELSREMERLQTEMDNAGSPAQKEVLKQKYYMAKAYLIEGGTFSPGVYRVEGKEESFTLERLNGIMAWGKWDNGEEGAVPISMLVLA